MYSGTDLNPKQPSEEEIAQAERQLALVSAVRNKDTAQIDQLLEEGADINHLDGENRAPLHYAVEGADRDIVLHLIRRGADINLQGPHKSTPLHICADKENKDLAMLFLRRGALLDLRDEWGLTVPDRAAMAHRRDMAAFLREGQIIQRSNQVKRIYAGRHHRPRPH